MSPEHLEDFGDFPIDTRTFVAVADSLDDLSWAVSIPFESPTNAKLFAQQNHREGRYVRISNIAHPLLSTDHVEILTPVNGG